MKKPRYLSFANEWHSVALDSNKIFISLCLKIVHLLDVDAPSTKRKSATILGFLATVLSVILQSLKRSANSFNARQVDC